MKELNINTDFEFDFYLTRKNATTRKVEGATGLSGVAGRFAATPNGAAITSTSTALAEAAATAHYVGTLDTSVMVTNMSAYVGQVVYAICSKSGDIDCEYVPYLVVSAHQAASA